MVATNADVMLIGGRVIDPETGFDDTANVGIRDGSIVSIGPEAIEAGEVVDVTGLIVAPGFIDLHSHAQNLPGHRMQALDGVTTTLELEAGALPIADYYAAAVAEGRPLNFGYSAGWIHSRMSVLDGVADADPLHDSADRLGMSTFEKFQDGPRWREAADDSEIHEILARVREQIAAGAIGVGVLAGYAPGFTKQELDGLAQLAAEVQQPLFVHSRSMADIDHGGALDAVRELIDVAERFDAPIHLCHMNSTSGQRVNSIANEMREAQARGVSITTEAYPYGAGSTVIGASFLNPKRLAANNMSPQSIIYLATGERIASAERLAEIREVDPGGICVLENFDLTDDHQTDLLFEALTFPDAAMASDAIAVTYNGDEEHREAAEAAIIGDVWPLPDGLIAHPRSSGCFATVFSWLVRDAKVLDLTDALRRCTLIPADILADAAPAMRRKGRLQVGADADICVFDPESISPGGDYQHLAASTGVEYLYVSGTPVVAKGRLIPTALSGQPVYGSKRGNKLE